jgi:hypothetical protein
MIALGAGWAPQALFCEIMNSQVASAWEKRAKEDTKAEYFFAESWAIYAMPRDFVVRASVPRVSS